MGYLKYTNKNLLKNLIKMDYIKQIWLRYLTNSFVKYIFVDTLYIKYTIYYYNCFTSKTCFHFIYKDHKISPKIIIFPKHL